MKYNAGQIKAIIEFIVDDYRENVEDKRIEKVEVSACGSDFKILLWYPDKISTSGFNQGELESNYDLFVVRKEHTLQDIRKLVENSLESINPFVESVNV